MAAPPTFTAIAVEKHIDFYGTPKGTFSLLYSKTCLKRPLKNRQTKALTTNGSLMRSKVLQNAPLGAFCNSFDMYYAIIGIENQFWFSFWVAALDRFTVFTSHYQHKTSTIYIHIDTICMNFPVCILRGHRSNFLNFNIVLSLGIVFILANSAYEGHFLCS